MPSRRLDKGGISVGNNIEKFMTFSSPVKATVPLYTRVIKKITIMDGSRRKATKEQRRKNRIYRFVLG